MTKYKITKYGGKTKIKNLKSGESAEIDIESFMNGGYKTVPKFVNGVKYPPEEEIDYNVDPVTGLPLQQNTGGSIQQPRQKALGLNIETNGVQDIAGIQGQLQNQSLNKQDTTLYADRNQPEPGTSQNTYQMPNPYAGADIPTAAYTLGQSIQNKSTLGIIGSGLKMATGLGRNIVSGLGQANRQNQVMQEAMEKEKDNRNVVQYGNSYEEGGHYKGLDVFEKGGMKEEKMATGEYMKGVDNINTENYNSEVERGEYIQTNEGDVAEVIGNKHSSGGEKIEMEQGDRVLSDKLKIGAKSAKMLSEKYDIKVKYKNTYSDVLDKLRKKLKLDKLVEEDSVLLKKVADQELVEDTTTRDLNLQVLAEKKQELESRKAPLEDQRRAAFDTLFDMQEASKPKEKENFAEGGEKDENPFPKGSAKYRALEKFSKIGKTRRPLPQEITDLEKVIGGDPRYTKTVIKQPDTIVSDMAIQYGVPLGRAEELVAQFKNGGEYIPTYEEGVEFKGPGDKMKKVSKEEAKANVKAGKWKKVSAGRYVEEGTAGQEALSSYRSTWNKEKFPVFEDYVAAAEKWKKDNPDWDKRGTVGTEAKNYAAFSPVEGLVPNLGVQPQGLEITPLEGKDFKLQPRADSEPTGGNTFTATSRSQGIGAFLFPDESPLAPSGLQGTLKPEARFDRVRPTEINARPYLQDTRDREDSQIQSLEGLSPNVRAAVMSNLRANSQKSESDIRMNIDTQNLQSQEKAIYTNANIQRQEQNQNNNYRQGYEDRIYQAQANTEANYRNYLNAGQALNAQRFDDIHNMNLVNASNEDVAYVPGQGFIRKEGSSDKELLTNSIGHYEEGGNFEYKEFLEWKRNRGKM